MIWKMWAASCRYERGRSGSNASSRFSGIVASSRCAHVKTVLACATRYAGEPKAGASHRIPAMRARSFRICPSTQSLPRRTIGTRRTPIRARSSNASRSARTLMDTKGTPCLVRNSLVLRHELQPGCQYTFRSSSFLVVPFAFIRYTRPARHLNYRDSSLHGQTPGAKTRFAIDGAHAYDSWKSVRAIVRICDAVELLSNP